MLLPALALLLDLLLLLQLLGDAGLAQGLPLAALVGLGVEGCLKGRVPPHAHHHFLPQLRKKRRNWDGYTLVRSTQHAQLQYKLGRPRLLPHGALRNARAQIRVWRTPGKCPRLEQAGDTASGHQAAGPLTPAGLQLCLRSATQQYFLWVTQEFSTLR